MKVKIVIGTDVLELEKEINYFIKYNKINNIINISLSGTEALILYE